MKHIFTVHSHITYLMSIAIINFLQLDTNEIIIISYNTKFNPTYRPYPINYIKRGSSKGIFNRIFAIFRNFNHAKYLDDQINLLTSGELYFLYINYVIGNNRILLTNSKCIGLSFIEEGMDNYKEDSLLTYTVHSKSNSYRLPFVQRWTFLKNNSKDILREFTNEKLNLVPVHPSCFSLIPGIKYFSFSNYSFPNIQETKKHILDIKSVARYIDKNTTMSLDNSVVWVGDNVVNFYKMPVENYINAINKGITDFFKKNSFSKIYLKFHQDEHLNSKRETQKIFDLLNIETIIIDDSQSVEILLLNSKNIKIIGLTSSLLWYASLIGHEAYSINRYLKEHNHLKEQNIFWEKVTLL